MAEHHDAGHDHCPYCRACSDCMTGSTKAPAPGDVAICRECLRPAIFVSRDGRIAQRRATSTEQVAILSDPHAANLVRALAASPGDVDEAAAMFDSVDGQWSSDDAVVEP